MVGAEFCSVLVTITYVVNLRDYSGSSSGLEMSPRLRGTFLRGCPTTAHMR